VAKKDEFVTVQGTVDEVLPNATFRVILNDSQHKIIAYLGGRLRQNNIKVLMGDTVEIEMSPYDLTKGRITYRNK
jgi:translation initiation factor IF-1